MNDGPVRVFLTAATQDEMNAMYGVFLGDQGGRVFVASMATSLATLRETLPRIRSEVVVFDVGLMSGQPESDVTAFLESGLDQAVAVVLLPLALEHLRGTLVSLSRVREVLTKPVNYAELINRVHGVGLSHRAATCTVAPAQGYVHVTDSPAQAVAGQRVFAVYASKGGTGKTTVALNFAYRLQQAGIRTCLMGFDIPDDVGSILGMRRTPNSLNFYRRPGRDGFAASIQRKDGLEVVLSPNDHVEAARIEERRPDDEASIARLVEAARNHHPPYGAIVMDLPPTETEWSIQPLLRANTVILVLQPSVSDEIKLIDTVRLLTGVLDERYRIPKEAIYAVLNGVTEDDNITPQAVQEVVASKLNGYAPPVIGVIPWHSQVRPLQNRGVLPVTRIDEFTSNIDRMVDFFYQDLLGRSARARRKPIGLFGLKVRFT